MTRSAHPSHRPELDLVELRRARMLRDRYAASAEQPRRRSARHSWLRRGLLLLALACLGIYSFASIEQLWADHRSRVWLDSQTSSTAPTPAASAPFASAPVLTGVEASLSEPKISNGDLVGRLKIPDLGIEGAVEHGNSSSILRRAIGHLPGTPLPGQGGHVVLAGHRDSFFRELRRATRGQQITLSTPGGDFIYEIDGLSIVGPRDTEVLAPSDDERLTLITCYPFDYVGPAPRRFIVTAARSR